MFLFNNLFLSSLIIDFILQAKGYRVGPVYDDVLAMAWFFLELIVKSMSLEQTRLFFHSLPLGREIWLESSLHSLQLIS